MPKVKVIVIKNNLKYRIPGYKGGESFIPKMGQMIGLPKEIALIELKTGNIRKLLPEEREVYKKKMEEKKKKKAKK